MNVALPTLASTERAKPPAADHSDTDVTPTVSPFEQPSLQRPALRRGLGTQKWQQLRTTRGRKCQVTTSPSSELATTERHMTRVHEFEFHGAGGDECARRSRCSETPKSKKVFFTVKPKSRKRSPKSCCEQSSGHRSRAETPSPGELEADCVVPLAAAHELSVLRSVEVASEQESASLPCPSATTLGLNSLSECA
eukprot:CAMPEP_0194503364 /NCGR_PEP_ID=MMETSP0253-20130528/28340_1 /TAXON_ID=2966 /ORGANISM="Noctiluca scintillans" /LENGTH=194 /DNA_ID=CAMNT_0039345643 /DNA_START=280 /DNA_END=865 /DNA_ORIENTATION=-